MMEGADLVEATAITSFPVDGPDATDFLARWIGELRARPTLDAVVLGGITMAGLGVVDLTELAETLALPVLSVTRRDPREHRLQHALQSAGLEDRIALVDRAPDAVQARPGLYVAHAGIERRAALDLVRASARKSHFPEPLRVAHLIAAAIARGESRGRV